MDINTLVANLARLRAESARSEQFVEDAQKRLDESTLGRELEAARAALDAVKQERDEAESKLREALVEYYNETGDKHPHEGAGINITTTPVYEEIAAIAWAKSAMPKLVKETLDKRGFNKVARSGMFDFVTLEETPGAVISKDLSAFVKDSQSEDSDIPF